MKARHAYPLLFLVPSTMLAGVAAVIAAATAAGVLWIFVYGDNPWPASANTVTMAVASLVGLLVLVGLLLVAHRVGKKRESSGGLSKAHMLFALCLSVGVPMFVLLHQWRVGNFGGSQVPPNNSFKPTPLRGAA